jgi:hypothetical protein
MTLFDELRAACAAVMAKARHVQIDHGAVRLYALGLPLAELARPSYDRRYHYQDNPETTLAYVLMLDSINFGSGYFPHLKKRQGLSGYYTIAVSLKDYVAARGAPSAEELAALTPQDCADIFGQDLDHEAQSELMGLYAQALNELGDHLRRYYGGSFTGLVEAAGGSAARLVARLAEMAMFRDIANYHGLTVPFYKRAQITASDLALAFDGGGYGYFKDLGELTVFADNVLPHVLHVDGILRYDEELKGRIAAGEPLRAGSSEEIELRAAAVHAVELVVAELRSDGQAVTARDLDYLLWNRGQGQIYKELPRHRTRTIFY